ncbi:PAS domain-containing protein [Pelagibius sp. Alg239-R121]|uniref:PAS domain-containing protein n=1 Tax=Pelagibius sp. Alg239-R121 TaxID=2993448 RepID=UPI0024A62F58|nr:PAS domain-containing protein [Pelagibius sp. Alg239-R121]
MYSVTVTSDTADNLVSDKLPEQANESLCWALQYWDEHRGRRALPARGDVDPMDFPRLLPTTYLLEREPNHDFIVRVAGTRFREVYGREVTGQKVSEFIPYDSGRDFHLDVELCCKHHQPVFRDGRATWRPSGVATRFQRVLLPLGAYDTFVDHLLGFAVFFDEDGNPEI